MSCIYDACMHVAVKDFALKTLVFVLLFNASLLRKNINKLPAGFGEILTMTRILRNHQ